MGQGESGWNVDIKHIVNVINAAANYRNTTTAGTRCAADPVTLITNQWRERAINITDTQLECIQRRDVVPPAGFHKLELQHAHVRSVGNYIDVETGHWTGVQHNVLLARERVECYCNKQLVEYLVVYNSSTTITVTIAVAVTV